MMRGTAEQVYRPDYHCANKLGYVLKHIIVAEEKLGRHLKRNEVVYHLDGNLSNCDPDNIIVFKTINSKDIYVMGGTLIQNEDGSYSAVRREKKCVCAFCGKVFIPCRKEIKYCSTKCYHLAQRSPNMPSKKELRQHLIEMNHADIANAYNVSFKTVIDWCRNYNLPVKQSTIQKLREDVKAKEAQRIIQQLRTENAKLASKYEDDSDDGGEEDWLEI